MDTKLLTYLNTRQFFTNRWKGDIFDNSFYLSDKELRTFNITREQLEAMPQVKIVGLNSYNVQGVSEIDISLIKPHGRKLTKLHRYMLQCVVKSNLPTTIQPTAYWNTFIKHRNKFAELFFTVDEFAGRVHSPISSLSKDLRPHLLLNGEAVTSFDVSQMQPTLLAKILDKEVGNNAFSDTINNGTDIYTMLQQKSGLSTRDEAKKLFFQMLFSRPSNSLERLFNGANFIQWINWYKSTIDERNIHSKEKPYSNLAFLLQSYEVRVMGEIWAVLERLNIPFLTVHDEIIARQIDTEKVKKSMESVLSKHFATFKVNVKKSEIIEDIPSVDNVANVDENKPFYFCYVSKNGTLYIPTPRHKNTLTVYPTIESYNKRSCFPTFIDSTSIDVSVMDTQKIDLTTLKINL